MAYTVLSAGGGGARVGGEGKLIAAPWTVYSPASDASVLTVTVDRDRIYNAPVSIMRGSMNFPGAIILITFTAIMG